MGDLSRLLRTLVQLAITPCYLVSLLVGVCFTPQNVRADGGVIQFRSETGPLTVTLFSTPVPLRSGPADLSVLVEDAVTHDAVLDATVRITLRQPAHSPLTVEATRRQATNKLLYAAHPDIARSGKWQVTVSVTHSGLPAEAYGEIEVLPASPAIITYWPYFALVPGAIALFVLNQWLKDKQKAARST